MPKQYRIGCVVFSLFLASVIFFSSGMPLVRAAFYNASGLLGAFDNAGNPTYSQSNQITTNAKGMGAPDGVAVDTVSHRLFVRDNTNCRVMVYQLDSSDNIAATSASYVLGESDFTTVHSGFPYGSGANQISCYYGTISYDSGNQRLFVPDLYENRVLIFDVATSTIQNGEDASYILGDSTCDTTQSGMCYPSGSAFDPIHQRLFIGDEFNNRVLVYDVATSTIHNDENAENVLGQPDYTSTAPGGVGSYECSSLSSSTICEPADLGFDPVNQRLFVGENFNGRVTVWNVDPSTIQNGEGASYVLGQPNFTTSVVATTQSGMSKNPGPDAYDPATSRLFVTDPGYGPYNNRLLIYDVATSTIHNGENASYVLGQPNFTTSINPTSASQNTFRHTATPAFDPTNNHLWAVDFSNNRVLEWDVSTSSLALNGNDELPIGELGQYDANGNIDWTKSTPNNGPTIDSRYIQTPVGTPAVDTANHRLFIANSDGFVPRVLVFPLDASNSIATTSASYVLGQPDMGSNIVFRYSIPYEKYFDPADVAYDSTTQRLFVGTNGYDVYVFNVATSTVSNFEGASYELGQAAFGSVNTAITSQSLLSGGAANVVLDAINQRLFVADTNNNRVMVFNVSSSTIQTGENASSVIGQANFMSSGATSPLGAYPYAAASFGSNLYVANYTANTVSVIDTNTNTVTSTISVGNGPDGIAVIGTKLYVSNYNDNTVSVIDTNTNTVTATIGDAGSGLESIAAHGTNLYIPNGYANTVSVIDTNTNTVTSTISVGGGPGYLAVGGTNVYVANSYDNTVSVIDTNTNTVTSTIGVGSFPESIAIIGTKVYVVNDGDNTVSVIDANTNTVTATINVGSGPQGLGVLGTNLYVLNGNDNTVSVIDTNTNTVTATIGNNLASLLSKGFYHPFGLAYDAANQRLFVADANNNRVMVFNVATSSIQNGMSASYVLGQPNFVSNVDLNGTAAQSVLYYPTYLSYDASHQLLYVNDQNNNRVMVFNVATSSIQSGENAESVLGQPNFTSSGTSTLAQNNFNLFGRNAGASKSGGLFIDPVYNHLFITDTYDGRLLQDSLISLSSNTVPNPVLSNSYSATITPINSQGVVTFSVISGSLPVGLSLSSSTGVISGIATATTTATFSIQATDNLTTAQFFDQASYTITPAAGVPASPTAVSATAGNAQASVSFTPGGDGGSTILYYTAVSSPGSMSATSSGSPIVVSGLSNGQGYTFIVTATNGIGTSALSLPSGSVTPSAPGGGSAPTVMAGGGAPNTNNYGIPGSASGASMTSTTSLVLSSLASSTQPLSSSSSSSATTSSEASLQAEIASLEAELQSLMSQMANNSSSIQFTFSRDLQLNDNSLEVKNLQIYLNTHGFPVALKGPGSRGLETTRFGGNTYYALIKFQIKNGIRPTGYFGIITREAMNSHP